jgi:hypothetical protein
MYIAQGQAITNFLRTANVKGDTIDYYKYRIFLNDQISDSAFVCQDKGSLIFDNASNGVLLPGSAIWYYYECINPKAMNVCLDLYSMFPEISFYQVHKNKIIEYEKVGFHYSSMIQSYHTFRINFPIKNVSDTLHLFIKAKSLSIPFGLNEKIAFLEDSINEDIENRNKVVFITGVVLFALCLSLLMWLRLKENFYLFFALFSFSYIYYVHTRFGTLRDFFLFGDYAVGYEYYAIPYVSMIFFIILYASSYIKISQYKFLYRLLIVVLLLRACLFAVSVWTQDIDLFHPGYDNIGLLVCYIACWLNYKKDKSTGIVIAALTVLIFIFFLHASHYLGIYFDMPFLQYATIENVVFGVFAIFGVGVVIRLQQARKEKEIALQNLLEYGKVANSMLEQKVEERTLKIKQQSEVLEQQSLEIARMNDLLSKDNEKLKEDIEEVTHAHLMHKNASFEEFEKLYHNTDVCLKFLYDLKSERNYKYNCSKCGNSQGSFVPQKYATRCTRCGYVEPVTFYTLYYNVKFPLNKAFYLTYLVSTNQVYTLEKLSQMLELRKQTCLMYINKLKSVKLKSGAVKPGEEGWYNLIFTDTNN